MTLYKTYVRSQLEYCSLLWHPQSIEDIGTIEGVQRTFTSKIFGISHMNYWERLESLNLMSLQRRRERFIIIMMWKLLNGFAPNDIQIESHHSERLGLQVDLPRIPRECRSRVRTRFDLSFAYVGPRLWNVLPKKLNLIGEMDEFKRELTRFVLSLPDKPPVQGYVRANNNSLLEVAVGITPS